MSSLRLTQPVKSRTGTRGGSTDSPTEGLCFHYTSISQRGWSEPTVKCEIIFSSKQTCLRCTWCMYFKFKKIYKKKKNRICWKLHCDVLVFTLLYLRWMPGEKKQEKEDDRNRWSLRKAHWSLFFSKIWGCLGLIWGSGCSHHDHHHCLIFLHAHHLKWCAGAPKLLG